MAPVRGVCLADTYRCEESLSDVSGLARVRFDNGQGAGEVAGSADEYGGLARFGRNLWFRTKPATTFREVDSQSTNSSSRGLGLV